MFDQLGIVALIAVCVVVWIVWTTPSKRAPRPSTSIPLELATTDDILREMSGRPNLEFVLVLPSVVSGCTHLRVVIGGVPDRYASGMLSLAGEMVAGTCEGDG